MSFPASYAKAMAARAAREEDDRNRRLGALIAMIRRIDISSRPLKSGKRVVDAEVWRELINAANTAKKS